MSKPKGLETDRRVGIALSVLPSAQKLAVERITLSPQSFAQAASAPGRVRQMRTSSEPLYMMKVSPSLRLIYTLVGDTAYVVDVVEHATLNHFAIGKAVKKAVKAQGRTKASKAVTRKAPDAVEK